MECADIQQIEKFLNYGDPYTFALLMADSTNIFAEQKDYRNVEQILKNFGTLVKRKFSSGTILIPFESDMFVAFAPFVLDKNYLMKVFDALQQDFYESVKKQYPEKTVSVYIGCVTGTKKITLEELLVTAEKLMRAVKQNGKHGYKIMEGE